MTVKTVETEGQREFRRLVVEAMTKTPGQRKTEKARAARTRTKHERWAAEMREAGWRILAPGETR